MDSLLKRELTEKYFPTSLTSEKSNLLLKTIHSYDSSLIKIGVGGVFNKEDFQQKIESGASLVQIYTSFIYQGPRIINKLLN